MAKTDLKKYWFAIILAIIGILLMIWGYLVK